MPAASFFSLLSQQGDAFARTVILQLQTEKKDYFIFNGQKFSKQEVIGNLISWSKTKFPENYADLSVKSPDFSLPVFLSSLLDNIQAKYPEKNLPSSDQLQTWQQKLAEHEQWLKTLSYSDDPEVLTTFQALDLENQLKLISQHQQKIKTALDNDPALASLRQHWQSYLSLAEQEKIKHELAQNIVQDIVSGQQTSSKQADAAWQPNQNFLRQSLADSCGQDYQLAAAVPIKHRDQLANILGQSEIAQVSTAEKLALAQAKINQALVVSAPDRNQLEQMVGSTLGISQTKAKKVVDLFEAYLPANPNPSLNQVQQAIDHSLSHLSFQQAVSLEKNNISLAEVQQVLVPAVKGYYLALPLAQVEDYQNFPVSKQAQQWTERLQKLGVKKGISQLEDLDSVTTENLLRGINSTQIKKDLQALGVDINKLSDQEIGQLIKEKTKKGRLVRVHLKTEALEKLIEQGKIPFLLSWKIKLAAQKLKFSEFTAKLNSFRLKFYQHHLPGPTQRHLPKIQAYEKKWQNLKKGWLYIKKDSFLGIFLSPFHNLRKAGDRFSGWRWGQWKKVVDRISKKPETRKFLYYLPDKLKPSYWLRPAYWTRVGTGKLLYWAGTKLGQRAFGQTFRFIGSKLVNYSFSQIGKKLLTKGVGFLLKSALGLGTGGIGFIVSAGASLVLSSGGVKLLTKLAKLVVPALFCAAVAVIKFIAAHLAAFIGFSLGMTLGGVVGGLIGGGIGLGIDSLVAGTGGWGNAAAVLGNTGSAAAGFLPQVASAAGPALATTASVGIGGAVGGVAVTSLLLSSSLSAKFVQPDKPLAQVSPIIKSEYFTVAKTASPDYFSADQVALGNAQVIYSIKVTALIKDINITNITEQFTIIPDNSPPTSTLKPKLPIKIPAGQTMEIASYQLNFGSQYNNSTIANQVIITADITDGPSHEQASAQTTVILGDAPVLCFDFVNDDQAWTEAEIQTEKQAMAYLSQWPNFKNLLCSQGKISLIRMAGSTYGGWAKGVNEIVIYDKGLYLNGKINYYNILYTLTHESGHLIDYRHDDLMPKFKQSGASAQEGYLPTYRFESSLAEDFPETIAIFIMWDKITFSPDRGGKIDYPNDYPLHYKFALCHIYEPTNSFCH